MTLPNKLTLFRVALVPVMVVVALIPALNNHYIGAMSIANFINIFIFIIASLTDFLDGYLARKNNQVTTFGKFADPLADKLLVISAMIVLFTQFERSFEYNWYLPFWVITIVLGREFIVSGIRLVCVEHGKVIPAGFSGKAKTFTQMFAIIFLFLYQVNLFNYPVFGLIGAILMYASTALAIYSGCEYFIKNKKILLESM